MSEDKISVVVPVYNTEAYLSECLGSVARQTHRNIEVLLVDDGSTDGSPDICQEFVERDERFRYLRQDNAGQSAARNRGIREASGAFLAFIDSDDWWDEDILETLHDALVSNNAQFAMCQVHHEGFPNVIDPELFDMCVCNEEEFISNVLLSRNGFSAAVHHALFLTELAKGVSMAEGHLFEDLDYLVRLGGSLQRAVSLPCRKYHYRYREGNSSSRALLLRFEDMNAVYQSMQKHLELLGGRHLDELDQRYISNILCHLAEKAAIQDRRLFSEMRGAVLSKQWLPKMQTKSVRLRYRAMTCGRVAYMTMSSLYKAFRTIRSALRLPYRV